ncbi:DNA helicase/exodeoxyribonuclease V beta subunit [Crenobacter luteus]|uniref:exodeoxyribonuclease V subunit beta n=1 Tax=Crenobacter luteus TaxID=1452487 RepID=UPI0010DF844E|nr:exodeoxyribonuclease V subunit beta [Crenobacter luteus]TCP10930.1 DNA helicase/exodeoxyribonuclease V beta subunit [Crenobacter luteus]
MSEPIKLDPLACALDGVNLIEASAGTGKTWTIAALYLRLLLEADGETPPPRVDEILVVTYTKAATAELRARLRDRLAEALAAFEAGESKDGFLAALLARHAGEARERARLRIATALTGFDAASVYTIHGFCQRVLTDAAFESGQPFSAELVSDDGERLASLAADFWRQKLVGDAEVASLLAEEGDTPEAWLAEVRAFVGKPYLVPDAPPDTALAAARAAREAAWRRVADLDDETVEAGLTLLKTSKALNRHSYTARVCERVALLLAELIAAGVLPALTGKTRDDVARLSPEALADKTAAGQTPPAHPLFDAVGDWMAAEDAWRAAVDAKRAALKLAMIAWLDAALVAERQKVRERSFDDLLTDLAAALDDESRGPLLAAHMARTWRVALIDEFQDTDPVQYAIFEKGFIDTGRTVFLVGDPKQAIYSFRGADIFAYLAARSRASRHYTLSTNYRSDARLVETVNRLFARAAPFVLPGIDYRPVDARAGDTAGLAGDDGAPWRWFALPAREGGKAQSKESAQEPAAALCADEIVRLLSAARAGELSLKENGAPLAGGDIAVLVATHRQGDAMRDALAKRGVPAVSLSQESVFASREAHELAALMRAWAEPGHEGRLKEALATELVGLTSADLAALIDDESAWEGRLTAFADDHALWRERGFIALWRRFLAREAVAERLLPLPDGERRLTNLAHLAELIQRESDRLSGIAPLMAWFEARLAEPPTGEEALMRLESDAELVKIVTIHTAKGLQYPVVFCPFLWDGQLERKGTAFWRHQTDGVARLTPATGHPQSGAAREAALTETLSEKLRLLYVALTRAQYRQYVVWGPVSGMETAALSWLLHADGATGLADLPEDAFKPAAVQQALAGHVARGAPDEAFAAPSELPLRLPARLERRERVAARRLTRAVYTPWRVTSFTALAHVAGEAPPALAAERPDHDAAPVVVPVDADGDATEPARDRFAFPRGARAGVCLHGVFERIDFTAPAETHRETVLAELARAGFAEHWQDAALDMVTRTLAAPLDPGVTLAGVAAKKRLVELEFTLPIARLSLAKLKAILADPDNGLAEPLRRASAALDFGAVSGYLKGFIDLVVEAGGRFYLIDYKSNHLGARDEDYAPARLAEAIAREHYYLQYLFYCVALTRYLGSRGIGFEQSLPEVRYLFLRGMNGEGGGVWRDKPSARLVRALDAWLAGTA